LLPSSFWYHYTRVITAVFYDCDSYDIFDYQKALGTMDSPRNLLRLWVHSAKIGIFQLY